MNWQRAQTHDGGQFTALMHGALEVGRYWHQAAGFKPATRRNNCRTLATELDARLYILRANARWLAVNLGTRIFHGSLWNMALPARPHGNRTP